MDPSLSINSPNEDQVPPSCGFIRNRKKTNTTTTTATTTATATTSVPDERNESRKDMRVNSESM